MEIVIKIDEEIYKEALEGGYSHLYDNVVANAVSNAMPLPKGHGRLIDVDELFDSLIFSRDDFGIALENIFRKILYRAPVVIVASGESED